MTSDLSEGEVREGVDAISRARRVDLLLSVAVTQVSSVVEARVAVGSAVSLPSENGESHCAGVGVHADERTDQVRGVV